MCDFVVTRPLTRSSVEPRPPSRQGPARARIVETAQVRPGDLEGKPTSHIAIPRPPWTLVWTGAWGGTQGGRRSGPEEAGVATQGGKGVNLEYCTNHTAETPGLYCSHERRGHWGLALGGVFLYAIEAR